jgi:hypothetical protein
MPPEIVVLRGEVDGGLPRVKAPPVKLALQQPQFDRTSIEVDLSIRAATAAMTAAMEGARGYDATHIAMAVGKMAIRIVGDDPVGRAALSMFMAALCELDQNALDTSLN